MESAASPAPRRILLCVTGLSPQVVTETLYALAVARRPAWIPDEIHVVTTGEGRVRAELMLLDEVDGHFHRFCRDYGIAPGRIHFSPETLHVIRDRDGHELEDIRSQADNAAAADAITEWVRRLTADAHSELHASIAGGRKTMGFFLGYAFSLFARPQDRLSHVLVAPPFEANPAFFYPPPRPRVLLTASKRPVRTDQAEITLADIPIVRLRDGLPQALLEGAGSYSETVRQAQRSLGPPELVLDLAGRQAACSGVIVPLRPAELAFLAWFARRALEGRPGLPRQGIGPRESAEFLREYARIVPEMSGDYERVERAVKDGMDPNYFDQRRSLLHTALEQALGPACARLYHIRGDGARPRSRYALPLRPEEIRFEPLESEIEVDEEAAS